MPLGILAWTVGYTGEGPGRIARMTPFGYVNHLVRVS